MTVENSPTPPCLSSEELAHHVGEILRAVGVTPPLNLTDDGMVALRHAVLAAAAAGACKRFTASRPMVLSDWVLACREAAGLTQAQLGDLVGVGKGNVSAWENARHEPSYTQILRIGEQTGWPFRLPGLSETE